MKDLTRKTNAILKRLRAVILLGRVAYLVGQHLLTALNTTIKFK